MNTAFLNCNIWSVHSNLPPPYTNENFYLIERAYFYNSLESGIVEFNIECIQIPEFEIQDMHLLQGLDFDLINRYSIPILYRNNDIWKIDLRLYEDFKL
jgi:hypothetical protein